MILTDAGPLIAIIDRGERDHAACVAALLELTGPMVTTWPAFTEAMYLLGAAAGWRAQEAVWRLVLRGDLEIAEISGAESLAHVEALMDQNQDLPMDLAGATLVALAEQRGLQRIFSLDRDFRIYRLASGRAFDVIP